FPNHLDYFRDTPGDKYIGLHEGEANINTDSYWPRPYANVVNNDKNRLPSTRYLQNGAYLRLQNLQIGFNLPAHLTRKATLQSLRLYVATEHLVTFNELPNGIDPVATYSSWGVGKTYGAERMMSFGISLT